MYRVSGATAALLLIVLGLTLTGCPPCEQTRRVWVHNDSDQVLTGLYASSDPREEDWGPNLLETALQPGEFGMAKAVAASAGPLWVWPHIDGHGLMAVGVFNESQDAYIVVNQTDEGDLRARALGCPAPLTARYLLE